MDMKKQEAIEFKEIVTITKKVFERLLKMDCENKKVNNEKELLIFPQKVQKKGTNTIKRVSEQELRLLFIEEFKATYNKLYYSIETPTANKYRFGKTYDDIRIPDAEGQSALLDMCIFKQNNNKYQRILNIEFKHKNSAIKNIAKDFLKLMYENEKGVFIHLLNNTRKGEYKGTLRNNNDTGVFDKYYKSFKDFGGKWGDKSILLIIMSLDQKVLIHREIKKSDLKNLEPLFFKNDNKVDINSVNDWNTIRIN